MLVIGVGHLHGCQLSLIHDGFLEEVPLTACVAGNAAGTGTGTGTGTAGSRVTSRQIMWAVGHLHGCELPHVHDGFLEEIPLTTCVAGKAAGRPGRGKGEVSNL
jgi:hypothetical protein